MVVEEGTSDCLEMKMVFEKGPWEKEFLAETEREKDDTFARFGK